jgi:hypothetical protein
VFGGYYVLDAANIDEAIDAARASSRRGRLIEVRPVVEHHRAVYREGPGPRLQVVGDF